MVFEGAGRQTGDLVRGRRLREGERLVEPTPEDRPHAAAAQRARSPHPNDTTGTARRPRRGRTPPASPPARPRRSARRRRAPAASPRRRAASRRTPAPPVARVPDRRSCAARPRASGTAAGLGSRSSASWSTASSAAIACEARSRSASSGASDSTDSAWLTMSRSRPRYSRSRTWLIGSSRAPNLDVVRRTPLATARTLPCSSVRITTMRSASPS